MQSRRDDAETPGQVLIRWLWNPTNWIAVGSLAVSAYTFFHVQFSHGTVVVYLPRKIAVNAPADRAWSFLVSASLLNDAPARKFKFIEDARLLVKIRGASDVLECQWAGTTELVPTGEYRQRYGVDVAPAFRELDDQIAPRRRALPFVLQSQELQTRTLVFECPAERTKEIAKLPEPARLEVTLAVRTPTATYTSQLRAYQLTEEGRARSEDGSWTWIEQAAPAASRPARPARIGRPAAAIVSGSNGRLVDPTSRPRVDELTAELFAAPLRRSNTVGREFAHLPGLAAEPGADASM
jgi:hypothetical protein